MEPAKLLDYTLDAAKYFLKTTNTSATYVQLGGDGIEDVAMDAVVKILESNVRPQTKTYAIEVVRNVCFDKMKKRKLDLQSVMELPDTQIIPLESIDSLEAEMLRGLDEEDLELYGLWVTKGHTESEMADVYDVSPRTIRRRLLELKESIMEALDG